MDLLKKVFWILFLAALFIVAAKIGPIYYRAFSLSGICQHHADIFHRYNKKFVQTRLNEELDKLGIPKNQREIHLSKTKEKITVEIYYEDQANFFDYYKKDFVFIKECDGVLDSVIAN
ncbi:MAG: hypothetical protein ACR2NW_10250 [Thermodesulfobacteriota bacterium]